jgi:hypothetical protein
MHEDNAESEEDEKEGEDEEEEEEEIKCLNEQEKENSPEEIKENGTKKDDSPPNIKNLERSSDLSNLTDEKEWSWYDPKDNEVYFVISSSNKG